jgi:hypothetical protein
MRIAAGSQPGEVVIKTLSRKNPTHTHKEVGGVLKLQALSSSHSTTKKRKSLLTVS